MTKSVVAGVVTRTQLQPDRIYWRYCEEGSPAFDPDIFDDQKLGARNQLDGVALAGRGNTHFIVIDEQELVLRHYRRGGMAQRVSKDRYLYTGLERTRAMQEFSVLLELQKRGLRAPHPYACRVVRHGASYSASLITHRLPGHTLAECLAKNTIGVTQWQSIGNTIGRFHGEGLYHADLNAHNIMLDESGHVALIDFDRANFRRSGLTDLVGGWRRQNIDRLQRSLKKVAMQQKTMVDEDGLNELLQSWKAQLLK